ncbi:hypothetical protein B0H11DRAFT_1995143 [Mycena galericulata]|nr:hypothetical protein B0H11DRAFT_2004182 [Mycena galericulata]KAJ7500384.1 hypothetical protein B0H11DRAFT_1995143 [Mycena galericulata]
MSMSTPMSMYPLPRKGEDHGATCEICGVYLRRNTDLPRHMLTHSKDKHSMMYTCPMDNCGHRTLQKSNLATHIRTHTRAKPHKCPEYHANGAKCDFSTADPSSLHRHRKRKHGYTPRPKPLPMPGTYASYSAYEIAVGGRESEDVDVDAEGEPASECESEESLGAHGEGSRGTRALAGTETERQAIADAAVVPDADADADADLDAEGEPDPDQDGEGEPEDETEPVPLSAGPLLFENVSAERTEPPPAIDCPMPTTPDSPVIALAMDPSTAVLANISDTRTDVDNIAATRRPVEAQ